ncbi:Protein translocase subunit SecE [Candidatus Providencia siddallii]|uniref:Protein translocase subunit SecE n=1 Tax=Candidatus Providencia siddallii TaxID=1715285 RepID=A0A0M6W7V8_9GAMM|nr:Protein translocase subunit SecE [Candidatus Providencia siddallii]
MHPNKENKKYKKNSDNLKWIIIYTLLIITIIGNYYFHQYNLAIRAFVIIITTSIAGLISLWTVKGKKYLSFIKESLIEMKKVFWPSKQETLQITLIVVLVTTIMSLLLWGLDAILIQCISYTTNLNLF